MKNTIIFLLFLLIQTGIHAQEFQANYDESKVPDYQLPDILTGKDGQKISSVEEWEQRRKEIYTLFEEYVYGKMPAPPEKIRFEVVKTVDNALNGTAILKEIKILLTNNGKEHTFDLLLFIPRNSVKPVPAFLGFNFRGNQSVHHSPHISITDGFVKDDENCGIKNGKAGEASRGCRERRYPVNRIIDRGYAFATVYYGDVDPDYHDGFQNGVHRIFDEELTDTIQGENCASICAWAWSLSRVMDYFETDEDIDEDKVAVFGHSRLGKNALWAGASDQRFSIIISNNSGCGGAALSRRAFGETVWFINNNFPHWFCQNFKQFGNNEQALPVDQHMLIALMAPRPVYVASAQDDPWADPKGEFLSVKHAEPVYHLFDKKGLPADSMPVINRPVYNTLGYHIRNGKHDLTNYDWEIFLDFADNHFGY